MFPVKCEMLSQNDYFTKAILGPVRSPELGQVLSHEKSNIAYRYGVTRLSRRDWLKDPIRSDVAEYLELPAEFVILSDRIERLTRPRFGALSFGFCLAALTLIIGITLATLAKS